jgi:hypothetical protein
MILAILASIQHLRVPTLDSAENSYFGLAAGKGLSNFVDQPIPLIVFDWSVYLANVHFPSMLRKKVCHGTSLHASPKLYNTVSSTLPSTLLNTISWHNRTFVSTKTLISDPRKPELELPTRARTFPASTTAVGRTAVTFATSSTSTKTIADSGLSDQSGLSDDRLCFILCFVVAQNGVWKIYRLSSFFFSLPPGP